MPDDGSSGTAGRVCAVVDRTMLAPLWSRAAKAWLAFVAPGLGLPRDEDGLAIHFHLFGTSPKYWQCLCAVFGRVGLGDRW
jgi:hypothetical protein